MAKDPKTEEQKAAQKKKRKKIAAAVLAPLPVTGAKVGSRIGERIKARRQAKAVKAFDELSFGQAFKQKRKELGKDSTFTWRGKKYTTVTKDDLKKKAPKKKTFKQKRVQRIKKRIDKNLTKPGSTKKLGRKLKRLRRVSERMADGGVATDDLGLRNRPEKRAVRAMKPGSGKSVAAKVKRTSVPKNKKNMDLAPKRRQGASIKGYQGGGVADKIAWQEQQPAARISTRGPYASGRPHKVAGFGDINPNEPTNVRQRPGGMKTGGMAKKQGYSAKLDESLGVRHPGKKTQSLKSRRAESKGAEKAAGKRAYAAVKTMDKGTRKAKPRGVGVAKRGYGKALS